jgi:hypothetical protein
VNPDDYGLPFLVLLGGVALVAATCKVYLVWLDRKRRRGPK